LKLQKRKQIFVALRVFFGCAMCSFGFSFLVCCVLEVLALADFVREFAEI
jgi:hypothetical protein